jgi:hypothetical protein
MCSKDKLRREDIMLPATTTRVERNTRANVNRRIAQDIEKRVRYYAAHPSEIDARLAELDREWDIERVLEANAASIALGGVLLGTFINRLFLFVPIAVTGFLLQHALQGWCPPVPLLRGMGVRTAREIAWERYALKMLRGDFDSAVRSEQRGRDQPCVVMEASRS